MIINLLVIGFTALGLKTILFTKNGLKKSLEWIIVAFVLGYRTFEPFQGLKLHPIEIFIYASIIRVIMTKPSNFMKMPISISILGLFFVTFFTIDLITRYNYMVLLEFKNSLLIIMVFFMAKHIHFNKEYVVRLLKIYLHAATTISIIGIIEFAFPALVANIFGFPYQPEGIGETAYFTRLAFLFWGSHLAANLIPPVFPILLLLKSEKDYISNNNLLLTTVILINLFSIYLSGNRVSWLIITILLFLTIFMYKNILMPHMKFYIGFVVTVFVFYVYSQPVEGRYISAFKALTGQIDTRYDSSGGVRLARAEIAINSIISNPLGTGWGSQGWVHNDILQIGSTVGIIPGATLFFAPLLLLLKIYRIFSEIIVEHKTMLFTMIGLLIFIIVSIFLNGNFFLVQTGVPLFVLWAIIYSYVHTNSNLNHILTSNQSK